MRPWSLVPVLCAVLTAPASAGAQEDPFLLDGLLVTASPTLRTADAVGRYATVLNGEELRARGVSLLADALRTVPGLAVVRGGSFGAATSVFLRGGESDYVQVLVDGVQVNQPGGAFDFSGLSLDNVERIEVIRGPASSLYGSDAVAGVIHLITRTGRGATSGSAAMRAGSFGRRELSASVSGGGSTTGWAFSLGRLRTDGVLPFNNASHNTVLSGTVRMAPDAVTRASVSVRLGDRTYGFPTDGSGQVTDRNAFTFSDEATVSMSATRWLGEVLEVRGHVGVHKTDGGTDDQLDSPADTLGFFGFTSLDHMQRASADVRVNAHLGDHVGTVGSELEEQKQRSFSESISQWGETLGRSEVERWNRAMYAHVSGDVGALAYAVGSRLEDNERFGHFASWNAEVSWRMSSGTRLRASAGRSVKEPTFFENYARGFVQGNPDLEPERARAWDAGVEQDLFGGRVMMRATFFHQTFQDLIQYAAAPPARGAPNYFNVGRAVARGTEVAGEARLGPLRFGLDWGWFDTEVLDAGFEGGDGAAFVKGSRLLRRPTHTVHVHAAYDAEWGGGWLDFTTVGRRDDRDFSSFPAERVTLPRYTTLNAGLELPLMDDNGGAPGLTLTIRGENLLDARYEEVVGFPAPGRGLYLGARLGFGGA
jgi:vitamin B12 transporter